MICTFSAGSPGPLESIRPSACSAARSAAVAVPGSTVTRQPRLHRQRTMFFLQPRSKSATFSGCSPSARPAVGSKVEGCLQVTAATAPVTA